MRACLQCVGLLYLFCYNHTGYSCFDNNHRGREHGGPFGDLHLYPLLAASLEIYSIYVKNETANKTNKKKLTQREDGIWTPCHEPATPVLARRYHAPPTSAWLLLLAMPTLGFKSSAIVPERERCFGRFLKIPKILALKRAVRSSFLSQFEVP